MRGFGVRYAHGYPRAKAVRMAFVSAGTAEQWRQVVQEFYLSQVPAAGER
jgi:hypothetical protein